MLIDEIKGRALTGKEATFLCGDHDLDGASPSQRPGEVDSARSGTTQAVFSAFTMSRTT